MPAFGSDNMAGVSPQILAALAACNDGPARSYGADEVSARLERRFAELFERDVSVLLVSTGTAANTLCLAAATPPWGAVLCHPLSHIENDECGAPEFFTGGAKLVPVDGPLAKIDPEALRRKAREGKGDVHAVQPACVSITQATELGTLYTPDEVAALGAVCREAGLLLHMDGSRFANAVAALRVSPAQMSWKAGVDLLSFGATKNGAMGVEAVLCFDPKRAQELAFRRKRGGHLTSKMRFLAAQMEAYLADDLWLANARHANAMAARLAQGLASLEGVEVQPGAEANILFCKLPDGLATALLEAGFYFYADRWAPSVVRLVTSFATTTAEVDLFVAAAQRFVRSPAA
ncbi:threonine aldolase family protein [Ancylobacter oerskovii]|uniref:L-threonine aldolase n=1 Tax=Ancylobacter oerskovii TaxID=459519 RepID=A0ABW4YUN6_9HYPH|nr:low specificity L-threonine aldolase [Ancylobacter oerskovii]MBS7544427.1 low specificity L-threonine aldolase [Ancylobacter oerskovii]